MVPRVGGEEAAGAVVGVEIADHPAPAVVVDEHRPRGRRGVVGDVEARLQRRVDAGKLELEQLGHRDRRAVRGGGRLEHPRPGLFRRQAAGERALARPFRHLEDDVDVGREHLAVDPRRRAEDLPLNARAELAERAQDPVLGRRRKAGRARTRAPGYAIASGPISQALAGWPVYGHGEAQPDGSARSDTRGAAGRSLSGHRAAARAADGPDAADGDLVAAGPVDARAVPRPARRRSSLSTSPTRAPG